jgi:hypothetical protein
MLTTHALRLTRYVCCAAPDCRASTFAYLRENHNSVLGMREYALEAGEWGCWYLGRGMV